jgi:hypothetical protein
MKRCGGPQEKYGAMKSNVTIITHPGLMSDLNRGVRFRGAFPDYVLGTCRD